MVGPSGREVLQLVFLLFYFLCKGGIKKISRGVRLNVGGHMSAEDKDNKVSI